MITFHGAPSSRLFPDPSLPAFEPLHVFVLDQDLPVLEETLRGSGFSASADGLGYRAVFDYVITNRSLVDADITPAGEPDT